MGAWNRFGLSVFNYHVRCYIVIIIYVRNTILIKALSYISFMDRAREMILTLLRFRFRIPTLISNLNFRFAISVLDVFVVTLKYRISFSSFDSVAFDIYVYIYYDYDGVYNSITTLIGRDRRAP